MVIGDDTLQAVELWCWQGWVMTIGHNPCQKGTRENLN